jgi:UDP-N-acetyl-2-amino-2-deoxyglucuronate dehydrogenase
MQGSSYALIGVGFVAPRHMKAIKDTGGEMVAAYDVHDSVGILDSYFPKCKFFTSFEKFDEAVSYKRPDYLVICAPNYKHFDYINYGIRKGFKVICEKPLVISNRHIPFVSDRVKTILQLRYHPALVNLNVNGYHKVNLVYCTPRGAWYHESWKGDPSRSGGLLMNIGIHLVDMLLWKFGKPQGWKVYKHSRYEIVADLYLEKAEVLFKLSTLEGPTRNMIVDGENIDFNDGFTDLHTTCYRDILSGGGYGIKDVSEAIKLINSINENSGSHTR